MKILETNRLILRKFMPDDVPAVQRYVGVPENTLYMVWGPNTQEQTRAFVHMAISKAEENPVTNYQFAVTYKRSGELIGACNLAISGDTAEIGWILHRDYWGQGLGTEMGKALVDFGFGTLDLRRIVAHCDAENTGSYKVMEKTGMRREGLFLESRPAHKLSERKHSDELLYAILKDEWETHNEIEYYTALPYSFEGFIELPALDDGVIHLVCTEKKPAIPEKKYVPSYTFAICKGGEKVGVINLRIGYAGGLHGANLYYGGQIGYGIDEAHRGNGYAGRACHLLLPVAQAHRMEKLLITNAHTNTASRRVCEKLGARHLRVARVPAWHDLYQGGCKFVNIFEWMVSKDQ